jgi:uncharacterized coiled-coil protein SlyX
MTDVFVPVQVDVPRAKRIIEEWSSHIATAQERLEQLQKDLHEVWKPFHEANPKPIPDVNDKDYPKWGTYASTKAYAEAKKAYMSKFFADYNKKQEEFKPKTKAIFEAKIEMERKLQAAQQQMMIFEAVMKGVEHNRFSRKLRLLQPEEWEHRYVNEVIDVLRMLGFPRAVSKIAKARERPVPDGGAGKEKIHIRALGHREPVQYVLKVEW